MTRSTSRRMVVSLATACLVVVAGGAVADTVYPPTPPETAVLPTAEPAEVEPAADEETPAEVAPAAEDEAPAPEVLGARLATGGAELPVLAAVAGAAMAAGLVLVRSSRRRGSTANTPGR